MKRIYTTFAAVILALPNFAQTLNENFESWPVDSYMGDNSAAWTTWSGVTGTSEDVKVTNADASDGTKSIYFANASASGGPQDVVVPFGGEYNTGQFFFQSKFRVESGKGAYFNFQANTAIGSVWALNISMIQDGTLVMDDGVSVLITTTYPTDTWFTLTLDINLNTNSWELLIDGVSKGVVSNAINQVASIDIYPVNSNYGGNDVAGYYMDEFEFNHTPYTLPTLNAAVIDINNTNGLAGQATFPSAKIRNLGTTTITSFDLELTYAGTTLNESVTGVSIASLASYDVDFTDFIELLAGMNDITVTISNVNGSGSDGDVSDDIKTKLLNPVVPAPGKMVVGEEATGTWCGWCPRGAVYMDKMAALYDGYFAGIAVHNGDPMTYDPYDAGMGALIGGYPSAIVDRGADIDPSAIENDFLNRIVLTPQAFITNGATFDSATRLLKISVTADFQEDVTGNYKLACVITEDGITGTGSGYNQSNYYSGGGSGEMGGFEVLPNPVPAASMVYDHVARTIMPSFEGYSGLIPTTVNSGDIYTINFELTVPTTWDVDNLHIIGMLVDPAGDIENADATTIAEAVANGFIDSSVEVSGVVDNVNFELTIYPNPSNNLTLVTLNLLEANNVSLSIYDFSGKLIATQDYGQLNGPMNLPIQTENFANGLYTIQLNIGEVTTTEKLIVQH